MSMIQQKAEQIAGDLVPAGLGIDPITIIAIITALIQLFKGCALSPSQAAKRAASPRLLDRLAEAKALYAEAPDLTP